MEAQEEQVSLGSKEQTTHLIKGKRTKRVRPQSPMPFTVTANSSNGEGDTEDHSHVNARNFDDDVNCDINNTTTTNTCSAELQGSTEEEQDMAHCLILLARGQSWESPKLFEEDDDDTNNDGFLNYSKYSSRKFMEAVTMGYECKTCNRTFPSFQALGGHRASHKKTKAASGASIMAFDDEEFQLKNKNLFYLKLSNNNNSKGNNLYSSNKNKSKVHECSVCGAEFTSGQALGGHMRRHRGPVGTTNTTLSLTPMAAVEADEYQPKKRRKLVSLPLDLDLNLPAPEDDQREPKFAFGSNQRQQPNLVLSAPSLVDCHY